jgi:hypothetical protein
MGISEPINCLVVENAPMAFRWRGVLYEVTGVVSSWCAGDEWWNSCYLTDTKFWLVTVRNSSCRFRLRHDPDGRWWLLRDREAAEVAA